MILTKIFDDVRNIPNLARYHVETAMVKSDDLAKHILRVTSDHGREYGIRLEDEEEHLFSGVAFQLSEHNLLVLTAIPDQMLVISPRSIDEMGTTAHMLGNLHKPVEVKDGTISLLYDDVVRETLEQQGIPFEEVKRELGAPLPYANLGHHHHHDHESAEGHEHHHDHEHHDHACCHEHLHE